MGIVCRNRGGDILNVEMLDVYEGRIRNLVFAAEPADINARIGMTESRMSSNPSFLGQFQNELVRVRSGWMLLPSGAGLEYADETFPTFNRRGCSLEQVARYTDEGMIYVDRDLFSRMDDLNKAALYLHAVIYRIARNQEQETRSVRTRSIVAHLLAQNGNIAVIAELMSQLAAVSPGLDSWEGRWRDPRPDTPDSRQLCSFSITLNRVYNQLIVVILSTDDRPCDSVGRTVIFRCDPSGDSCTNQSGNWRNWRLRRIDGNSLLSNSGNGTHVVLHRY